MDHLLSYVSIKAKRILMRHLIDSVSWSKLMEESKGEDIYPCDERSLQRLQKKAIDKIYDFTSKRFGNTLDYLIESEELFHLKQSCRA